MRTRDVKAGERTDFGARLFEARSRIGWKQKQLAAAVGMSQSNIAELEVSGQGSAKTAQIAAALGVNPQWLATGQGPMLDGTVPDAANTVASERVAHYLVGKPESNDYRTVALSLAAALKESETELSVEQFIKLLEATYRKLQG